MSREEFLKELEEKLKLSFSQKVVDDNVTYYRNYIIEEIEKGKSEKEIIDELGDPRLIVNSIKESMGVDDEFYDYVEDEVDFEPDFVFSTGLGKIYRSLIFSPVFLAFVCGIIFGGFIIFMLLQSYYK